MGFYLNNFISYKTIGKNLLKIAGCEDLWVSINFPEIRHTIIIAVIYRYPNSDANTFIEALNKKLCEFESNKYDIYLFGDININIYNNQSNSISDKYLSMLASSGLCQLITKPTTVTDTSASLIDHIFASSLSNSVCPGIILNTVILAITSSHIVRFL